MPKSRPLVLAVVLLLLEHLLLAPSSAQGNWKPTQYTFRVVHSFPHDPAAFTQGLEYRNGFLYESTGLKGRSSLRKVRLETGEVLQRIDLSPEYFGEGITVLKNEIVQLTWRSHIGFVYNLSDFHLQRQFSYQGEGWGLTNNGREIFMSDGTSEIRVLDPTTLTEKRRFKVHEGTKQRAERTGVCRGRTLRQHLANRSHRPHLSQNRRGARLDRPHRPVKSCLSNGRRRGAERNRL
jgi:glutamine cyclotransferase